MINDYYTASTYNEWQRATKGIEQKRSEEVNERLDALPRTSCECGATYRAHMVPAFCSCGKSIPTNLPDWLLKTAALHKKGNTNSN